MKLNFTSLEYFRKAAKMEHLTKAAEALHITQPALSRTIRAWKRNWVSPSLNGKEEISISPGTVTSF